MNATNIPLGQPKVKPSLLGSVRDELHQRALDRAILHLLNVHNMTHQQIANELFEGNVTKQAIQYRIHQIKKGGEK